MTPRSRTPDRSARSTVECDVIRKRINDVEVAAANQAEPAAPPDLPGQVG